MGRDYPSHSLFMRLNSISNPIALPLAAVLPHSCHCRLFFYSDEIRAPEWGKA